MDKSKLKDEFGELTPEEARRVDELVDYAKTILKANSNAEIEEFVINSLRRSRSKDSQSEK